MNRKIKDQIANICIFSAAGLTVIICAVILGFVLWKGIPGINLGFLTRMWEDKTTIVTVQKKEETLGITLTDNEEKQIKISYIAGGSPVESALNLKKEPYPIKKGDILVKVGTETLEKADAKEAEKWIADSPDGELRLKVMRPGGGIVPMLVSTIYMILLSLAIAAPIGILSAIYLNEYAKPGKLKNLIRFAIQNLAGIPSIIYGLFGMLVFVQIMKMQYSVLAGAATMSMILLPTIISTTEEALKEIPNTYRESSLGLGATKLQTIRTVILPNAVPGILVAVILSIGRIVGESAALIWTAGTVAQIPAAFTGNEAAAATLTTKLYWIIKETADLNSACAIAVVLLALIILLNIAAKVITRCFLRRQNG